MKQNNWRPRNAHASMVATRQPKHDLPIDRLARESLPSTRRWSFGFRHFRELKYFGFDSPEVGKRWFVSLLLRCRELSDYRVGVLMSDLEVRAGTLRMHDLDWDARNIPIRLGELDWIEPFYRGNALEYSLFQIAISKAEGRIIGFLDEQWIFQIVLLDPLHNAQPSKYNDYKVRLSKPLGCEVTALRHEVLQVAAKCRERGCGCEADLAQALQWRRDQPGAAIVMPVVGTEIEDADQLIAEGRVGSYRDIFAAGLVAVLERRLDSRGSKRPAFAVGRRSRPAIRLRGLVRMRLPPSARQHPSAMADHQRALGPG
jgi:hypothetical protein